MRAVVVLGMHRSGTSCLAGMLAAGGLASAGEAIRNWDNARGHHEMLDVVRLDEAVLAHSGGHWLAAPRELRWTDAHAAARDAVLRARVDGRPALIKDPRALLTLPFWRASTVPFHAIGIVRHPLAVARSLESWRGTPLAEGIALWTAHAHALERDRAAHAYPLVDFDLPRAAFIEAVLAACATFGEPFDAAALAAAYEDQLVHHDDGDAPDVPGLAEALELHRQLNRGPVPGLRPHDDGEAPDVPGPVPGFLDLGQDVGIGEGVGARARFPRVEIAAFERALATNERADAMVQARRALASVRDASAVLVPIVTSLLRRRAFTDARALVEQHARRGDGGDASRVDDGLAELLLGKIALAAGEAERAVQHLERACAMSRPYFQARHLLPQALRAAGRAADARAALREVVREALYPHGPLATLAEWSWLDGAHARARDEMREAIAAAPPHRRGRLRTRLAEWLVAAGEVDGARSELEQAIAEDPGYPRSREVLDAVLAAIH